MYIPFAEYGLFYRALLQKRPIISSPFPCTYLSPSLLPSFPPSFFPRTDLPPFPPPTLPSSPFVFIYLSPPPSLPPSPFSSMSLPPFLTPSLILSLSPHSLFVLLLPPDEGTGTRPDYLVNRVPKKMRGHPGKKIAQKSRNSCTVNGRGCGCIGTVDSGPKCTQC